MRILLALLLATSAHAVTTLDWIGNKSITQGGNFAFTLHATDPAGPVTYSVTGAPAGSTFDAATGAFSWTPDPGFVGKVPKVTFTAGTAEPQPVTLNVYPTKPFVDIYPTINCIGVRVWPVKDEVASASIQYRKRGETAWRQGLDPVVCWGNSYSEEYDYVARKLWPMDNLRERTVKRVHGSLFYLSPATTYDVRVTLKRTDGSVSSIEDGSATTWDEVAPFGISAGTVRDVGAGQRYATPALGIAAAAPGDIVLLHPGVYAGFTILKSGTPGNPITIRGMPGAELTAGVRFGTSTTNGAHDVIVEGLKITMTAGYGAIIWGQRNVFQDCTITATNNDSGTTSAFAVASAEKVVCRRNRFDSPAGKPFGISLSRGVVVQDNWIHSGKSLQDGISTETCQDLDVVGNDIQSATSDDFWECELGVTINVRVWANKFDASVSMKFMSLMPMLLGPVYVHHNTVYNTNAVFKHAMTIYPLLKDAAGKVDGAPEWGKVFFLNNTVIRTPAMFGAANGEFFHYYGPSHTVLLNNVFLGYFLDKRMTMPAYYTGAALVGATGSSVVESDFNNWYNGYTHASIIPGKDAHSQWVDPLLKNPVWAAVNAELQASSPCIDAGMVLANITDGYKGSAPDMGAFESDGSVPTAPLVAGEIGAGVVSDTTAAMLLAGTTGGLPPYSLQWQRDGIDILGMPDNGLLPDTQYTYRVRVTDAQGTVALTAPITVTTTAPAWWVKARADLLGLKPMLTEQDLAVLRYIMQYKSGG